MKTVFERLTEDENYTRLKNDLFSHLSAKLSEINGVKPSMGERQATYDEAVKRVGEWRGRDLFYKYITSGAGNGPFIELADGSIKYDLITGIGVYFYGHGHVELFKHSFDALWGDIMQGNLAPGAEYHNLMQELLASVGTESRLKHVWLSTCGATANENALKLIRQKKFPATKVFAFKDCFAGRTTALQEITDNAAYRQGQPTYGEVTYLPFYDPKSKLTSEDQAREVISKMKEEMARHPGRYAMFEFELVQGEGGFTAVTREFILPIVQEARAAGLAIWDDEVQTFGRTGEVFCYQKLGLDEYVDVVTVGKLLQNAAVLFTKEYNPKPGLISGTFAGASSGLAAASWVVRDLRERMSGPKGRIAELEAITQNEFKKLKQGPAGRYLAEYSTFGGMVAFTVFRGTLDDTKRLLSTMFKNGAIAFYCGHGPYKVRMLPPFGVITNEQWCDVFKVIEASIVETAKEMGL